MGLRIFSSLKTPISRTETFLGYLRSAKNQDLRILIHLYLKIEGVLNTMRTVRLGENREERPSLSEES